jgi:hypothetical protein
VAARLAAVIGGGTLDECRVVSPAATGCGGTLTWTKLPNVPPPLTAASPAATGYGGMCDVSLGQRAATVVLTFALRGGLFWHFTGAGGLICQNFCMKLYNSSE